MYCKIDVLKWDIFNDVNDLQFVNIWPILVAFEVSKLDKSNEVKAQQFMNILDISMILDTSKLDKSNDFNLMHPLNISIIRLHFVLKLEKFISTMEEQSLNIHWHSVISFSQTNLTILSGFKIYFDLTDFSISSIYTLLGFVNGFLLQILS